MRSGKDFNRTVRHGDRVGTRTLVLHARLETGAMSHGPLVGFVVSKAVGTAVMRNRVKRRLRHLTADRLPSTPIQARIVVRALPAAATEPDRLPADLDFAWSRISRKWQPGYQPAGTRHGRRTEELPGGTKAPE